MKNPAAVSLGRLGGLKRMKALSKKEREDLARRGGRAAAKKLREQHTHYVCDAILKYDGGKSKCCECSHHTCQREGLQ